MTLPTPNSKVDEVRLRRLQLWLALNFVALAAYALFVNTRPLELEKYGFDQGCEVVSPQFTLRALRVSWFAGSWNLKNGVLHSLQL